MTKAWLVAVGVSLALLLAGPATGGRQRPYVLTAVALRARLTVDWRGGSHCESYFPPRLTLQLFPR